MIITGPGRQIVDLGDRVVRAAVRAEPVRARLEVRLEDGFEHQLEGGLDHPVGHSGDPETCAACRSSSGSSPAAPGPGGTRQTSAPPGARSRNTPTPPGRFSMSATVAPSIPGVRDPLFCLTAKPGVGQERRVTDEVEQVTEPAGGIFSRPAVQLGLHPPYRAVGRHLKCSRLSPPRRRDSPAHLRALHSPPCLTRCRPSPCDAALPRPGVLRRLRPARAFGRHRAYPPPAFPAGRRRAERTRAVPTFTVVRSSGSGTRLYPCGLATATPQSFTVASRSQASKTRTGVPRP